MAKLGAHGTELVRIVKKSCGTDDDTIWNRVHYSFRSDGHILCKYVSRFRGMDRNYSGGWKLARKFKPEICKDPVKLREAVERKVKYMISIGFTREK